MEFKKLPLNSKKLLDEIVQAENPTQLLSDRFDHVSGKEDEILRGIIRELCQAGYISIPIWGDNKPGHVVVNNSARTYDATISANGEVNIPFFKLIDEIPNLSNCFQNMGGVQTIYTHPMFIKWKENVKYEVRQLKQDSLTTDLIELLDRFNGWSDRKMLSEAKAKCEVIRDHYGEYLKKNDSGGNIEVNKRKVFIVHGRDTQTRDNVELFLQMSQAVAVQLLENSLIIQMFLLLSYFIPLVMRGGSKAPIYSEVVRARMSYLNMDISMQS